MTPDHDSIDDFISKLKEREKELNCLYNVEEILNNSDDIDTALQQIVNIVPSGWQFPERCSVRIRCGDQEYCSANFRETGWSQAAPVKLEDGSNADIAIFCANYLPPDDDDPFLQEEQKLLNNIADRVAKYILHQRNRTLLREWEIAKEKLARKDQNEWRVILELLQKTDHSLYLYVSRKMIYYLCWNGVEEALELWEHFGADQKLKQSRISEDNTPIPKVSLDLLHISSDIFDIAAKSMSSDEIFANIQHWIRTSKTNLLVRSLDSRDSSMGEMVDAIQHFQHVIPDFSELPASTRQVVSTSLLTGFFSDQLDFIRIARDYIHISDMYKLLKRMIYSARGRGKVGGKSAGLLLASQILKKKSADHEELRHVKIPKTWYITSNEIFKFVLYNHLEEVIEQKYKPIELVRVEYPHIVQIFKNSPFPSEMINGPSRALDDFGDHPLIVRSSSMLEDRLGTAFSGKYKSLFLANQGSKEERLEALLDAVAEVYASTFGPEPIEYRAERGLLEFHEEMGIMIEEVVGTQVGPYFFPSYAGVAFSNNEFRWSPRIQRNDGLIRMVPGLGTRAVDRVADDYPVLIAPGQPDLRVNVGVDECVRYAPRYVDVINLETNTFETIEFDALVKQYGDQIPAIEQMVSVLNHDHFTLPGLMTDFAGEEVVVTFEGLRRQTRFVQQIRTMLTVLEETMQVPVDIEFASNGKELYLLQCRSQSGFLQSEAPSIPQDLPEESVVFSASKFVSNGDIRDITHIVYVDPQGYSELGERADLLRVGRVVSKLNRLLPKRQFILMGPGRWGSRGDMRLGVNINYSDINNTAVLIEIAMQQGNYLPDLSFGTHFFQDLVEASIQYLPLYPDSDDVVFNARFFTRSPNILSQLLPKYESLSSTVKVIDVAEVSGGQALHLVMNADLDEALAYLDDPLSGAPKAVKDHVYAERASEDFWR